MVDRVDDLDFFTVNLSSASPAKGQIVNLTYPEIVDPGGMVDINASIKNIGGQSGRFRIKMYIDGVLDSTSARFILASGETSPDKIYPFSAPTTGTSIEISIECIRVI